MFLSSFSSSREKPGVNQPNLITYLVQEVRKATEVKIELCDKEIMHFTPEDEENFKHS